MTTRIILDEHLLGLTANAGETVECPNLKTTGDVIAHEGATITLPVATKTGDVWAYEGATITLPLATTTGDVWAYEGATITMPLATTTGNVWAHEGAMITMPLATTTGDVWAYEGATLNAPLISDRIHTYTGVEHGGYQLLRATCGTYVAGCRGPFTVAEALKHWNRSDERAVLFTAAIKKLEGME